MRDKRDYIHKPCDTETEVSGPEFEAMSDPLAGMRTTYCAHCDDQFPVSEFEWSDTGEPISSYYERHLKNATASDIRWCGNGGLFFLALAGFLVGAGVGVVTGFMTTWFVGTIVSVVLALIGAVAGIVLRETIVTKRITRRVCGVSDTRELN